MKTLIRFGLIALLAPILFRAGDVAISSVSEKLHELGELGGSDERDGRAVRVVAVVDGDTLKVKLGVKDVYVRLIGIDTPEVVRPGVPQECGGPQASASMRSLVSPGYEVELIRDRSQDDRDRYGRLLRYAELDGTDLAREQVARGWAEVYVYDSNPYARLGAFKKASAGARDHGRGVWDACGGDFHSGS